MGTSADIAIVRMRAYLNLPLVERCRELGMLIEESSTTELQLVFPALIDSIFGVTNNIGWGLHNINLKRHPLEYDTISHFLSPQGPVFSLCYKLLPDSYLKYDFPVSYLPTKIKHMFEEGIVPPFYSDKLKDEQNIRLPSSLSMNPFEYYIFHFAYHLTNPWLQIQSNENIWLNWETIYVQLAHSYLYHFLPRDNSPVLPIIGPYIKKTPRKLMQSPDSRKLQTPRLLRTSILSPSVSSTPSGVPQLQQQQLQQQQQQQQQQHQQQQQQQCLPQVWRSETIVQVFLDFWLEYTEQDKLISPSISNCLPRRNSIHSGEHIRLVRAFIKTLHEFANSTSGDKSAMDELKRVILPSVQGKIYIFLRKAIHHWPLDSSFRLILEAWLSFIQPWRYIPEIGYTKEGKSDEEDRGKIYDPSRWMSFIANNLLAYTAIFQQLIPRFMRTDLVAPKNSLMLFRVTKVFSQPHLTSMLCIAETCIEDINTARGQISTNQWSPIVQHQIIELEGPTYQYIPLFSETTLSQIIKLLITIKQAYVTALSITGSLEKRRTERNILRSIWGFFNGDDYSIDEIGLTERKRVPGFLASAQQQLINIFQLKDMPDIAIAPDQEYHDSILSTSFCNQSHDCITDIDYKRPGVFLPNQEKRQICRYIQYKGDPELQPVKSNEFAFLVRNFYKICQFINTKYATEIIFIYNKNNFIGRVARRILQPPTKVIHLQKRTYTGLLPASEEHIPPRLSLRTLANYNFLIFIIVGALVSCLLGYNVPIFFIFITLMWIVHIFIGAACEPWLDIMNHSTFRPNASAFSIN